MNQFHWTTYSDIPILVHDTDSFINISVSLSSHTTKVNKFLTSKRWKKLLAFFNKTHDESFKNEINPDIDEKSIIIPCEQLDTLHENGIYILTDSNQFNGTYVHPSLFHFILEYVDINYGFNVSDAMTEVLTPPTTSINSSLMSQYDIDKEQVHEFIIDNINKFSSSTPNSHIMSDYIEWCKKNNTSPVSGPKNYLSTLLREYCTCCMISKTRPSYIINSSPIVTDFIKDLNSFMQETNETCQSLYSNKCRAYNKYSKYISDKKLHLLSRDSFSKYINDHL